MAKGLNPETYSLRLRTKLKLAPPQSKILGTPLIMPKWFSAIVKHALPNWKLCSVAVTMLLLKLSNFTNSSDDMFFWKSFKSLGSRFKRLPGVKPNLYSTYFVD